MRFAHDRADLRLRRREIRRRESADEYLADPYPAAETILRGRVGHDDHVVHVVAIGRLSLRGEHADDGERDVAELYSLPDGVSAREQVLGDCGSEHCHPANRAYVSIVEEDAGGQRPVADALEVGIDAIDHRPPVGISADCLRAREDDGSDAGEKQSLPLQLLRIRERQPVEAARSLARAALLRSSRRDDDHVRAEVLYLLLDARPRAVPHCDHHDHGAHADDDPKHREQRAHLVLQDALRGDLDQDGFSHAVTASSRSSAAARSSAAMCRSVTASSWMMRPSRTSTERLA